MERPNLVLCGFMASGKTTVARLLAAETGMTLVDTDEWIEAREGRSVRRLFDELGEPYFRSVERRAVAFASSPSGAIVSAGGGVVLDPENIFRLRSTGRIFCLTADPATVFERLRGDASRPLAADWQSVEEVAAKLAVRAPFYAAIPERVETAGRSPEAVAAEVLRRYEAAGGG